LDKDLFTPIAVISAQSILAYREPPQDATPPGKFQPVEALLGAANEFVAPAKSFEVSHEEPKLL
jgi:hypothetical protein